MLSQRCQLATLLLLISAAAATETACVPRCDAYKVLSATVEQMKATDPGQPQGMGWHEICRPHVRTRAGVLSCLRGKWVVVMGCSWTQAFTLALLQLLDPQPEPFSARRWYNASTEKVKPNLGFVDAMWDEHGKLTHKRVGETHLLTRVPPVERPPGKWRGTRITQLGLKFWPDVAGSWEELMAGGNDNATAASWRGTPIALMVQSGTWYRSMSNGRFCVLRQDLCHVTGTALKNVFVEEGRAAVDALDAWAAAHRDTRVDIHLATVACSEKSEPCRPSMREGLFDALLPKNSRNARTAHFHPFDLAALANAWPKERADSHPSLALSTWIFSTWLTHICGMNDEYAPLPASGCAPAERVVFDDSCKAAAMKRRCAGTQCSGWASFQHVRCTYQVRTTDSTSTRMKLL